MAADKLTRAVKAHCIHKGMWRAYSGLKDTALEPCYIVPAAEYERLVRKGKKHGKA